jgi:hypothetical protein
MPIFSANCEQIEVPGTGDFTRLIAGTCLHILSKKGVKEAKQRDCFAPNFKIS